MRRLILDGGQSVGNVLFDNVHVIGAYDFWQQSCSSNPSEHAPAYGNIRFSNSDIYAIRVAFNWYNILETAAFTVTAYNYGVLAINNGHLKETMFGPTTVFDGVAHAIYINSNASNTHTVFRGKYQFSGTPFGGAPYTGAAFTLQNPQDVQPYDNNTDANGLKLNGLTVDGAGGRVLEAVQGGTGHSIEHITMTGVVARRYCLNVAADPVYVSTTAPTAVTIVGSQFTTDQTACHTSTPPYPAGLAINNGGGPSAVANNLIAQGVPY